MVAKIQGVKFRVGGKTSITYHRLSQNFSPKQMKIFYKIFEMPNKMQFSSTMAAQSSAKRILKIIKNLLIYQLLS